MPILRILAKNPLGLFFIRNQQNDSRMAAEWQQNDSRMAAEWQQNGNRMATEWQQNGNRIAEEWQQNGHTKPQLLLKITESRKGKKGFRPHPQNSFAFFKNKTLTISACSPNWYLIKNTCYHFDNRNMDFFGASLECISKGA